MCYVEKKKSLQHSVSQKKAKNSTATANVKASPSLISTHLLRLTTHDGTPCEFGGPSRVFFRDACKARASVQKMLSQSKGTTRALKPKESTDETKYRND